MGARTQSRTENREYSILTSFNIPIAIDKKIGSLLERRRKEALAKIPAEKKIMSDLRKRIITVKEGNKLLTERKRLENPNNRSITKKEIMIEALELLFQKEKI